MASPEAVRVDKWLWAVRIFKTRSMSNDACSSGRVRVNGEVAKPATKLKSGDLLEVRRRDRIVIVRVEQLLEKRVSASLAADAIEDLSPPVPTRSDEPDQAVAAKRERGSGRPTKRDRRRIQQLRGRD